MKRFDIEVENGRAYLVGNPDGKYVSYSDAVEANCAVNQAQQAEPVARVVKYANGEKSISWSDKALRDIPHGALLYAKPPALAVPDGYALVPIEPTREMFKAVDKLNDEMFAGGCAHGANFEQLWEAAILAAPKP